VPERQNPGRRDDREGGEHSEIQEQFAAEVVQGESPFLGYDRVQKRGFLKKPVLGPWFS
jgi:hypothetical protein